MLHKNESIGKYTSAGHIIGEMCRCGHTNEHHHVQTLRNKETREVINDLRGKPEQLEGQGPCDVSECDCRKFTWVAFLYS